MLDQLSVVCIAMELVLAAVSGKILIGSLFRVSHPGPVCGAAAAGG